VAVLDDDLKFTVREGAYDSRVSIDVDDGLGATLGGRNGVDGVNNALDTGLVLTTHLGFGGFPGTALAVTTEQAVKAVSFAELGTLLRSHATED
jgi:hypothetical protein